jgi:hypothetical protein
VVTNSIFDTRYLEQYWALLGAHTLLMSPSHGIAPLVGLNQTKPKNHYAKAMRAMSEVAQAWCNVQNTVFEGFTRAVWADQVVWLARMGVHSARKELQKPLKTFMQWFGFCKLLLQQLQIHL